jgi:outer membrane protein OmpA-like peptidoglycan-associated protein
MTRNSEALSWISIVASFVGLVVLTWLGMSEKSLSNARDTLSERQEHPAEIQRNGVTPASENPSPTVETAGMKLQITGEQVAVALNLPMGKSDSALRKVLLRHFPPAALDYEIIRNAPPQSAAWLGGLPDLLDQLLDARAPGDVQFFIEGNRVNVTAPVTNPREKLAMEGALTTVFDTGFEVSSDLDVAATRLQPPILRAASTGNVLELSGRLPEQYRQSDKLDRLKVAMGAGFVDNAISYADDVDDSALIDFVTRQLVPLTDYGENPSIDVHDGKLRITVSSSQPDAAQRLQAWLASSDLDASAYEVIVDNVVNNGEAAASEPAATQPVDQPAAQAAVTPDLMPIDQTPRLLEVTFAYNSFELYPASLTALDRLVERLSGEPSLALVIEGHTDSTGTPEVNLYVSQQRADAVRKYLMDSGIEGDRLVAVGFGDTRPISSNSTRVGRSKNRRIEIRQGENS